MSLRERKKRLAQATIEETALRLFQQQGYEQTSIQDIANAVMMSSRTFFRYFASKEDVLLEPMHPRDAQRDCDHEIFPKQFPTRMICPSFNLASCDTQKLKVWKDP